MFDLNWTPKAHQTFKELEQAAEKAKLNRAKKENKKSSIQEGLFQQLVKTLKCRVWGATEQKTGLRINLFG